MKPVRVIFVGRASSGKSLGYADFPRPHLVQDIDNKVEETFLYFFRGRVPIKRIDNYAQFDPENLTDIQYIEVKDFEPMYQDMKQIIANPPMNGANPGTWTVDSCTAIADNAIGYSLSMRGRSGKQTGVIPIPDLPEWLSESMFLSSLMSEVKSLTCNFVLTAHISIVEREIMTTKDEKRNNPFAAGTTTKVTKQIMTGGTKIGAKIPTYFSEIWNFKAIPPSNPLDKPEFKVYTGPTDDYDQARTKFPLPYEIDVTVKEGEDKPSLWQIVDAARRSVIAETNLVL